MIVGRGLLAKAITDIDSENFIFYANGISNSVLHQISRNNFELNEIKEIADKGEKAVFVYFSTCQVNSVCNYNRPYVQHKIAIEEYVRKHFHKYLIVRTSNLVGHNPWNSHTLFNYLYQAITVKEPITINPVLYRNFLDAEHFAKLLQTYLKMENHNELYIDNHNGTIEIVNPVSYRMNEILKEFEIYFSCKFIVNEIDEISEFAVFDLDTNLSLDLIRESEINTGNYIPYLLDKYYKEIDSNLPPH